MNKRYIKNAIVNPLLNEAFNNVEKVYHIYNDNSPESIARTQKIKKVVDMLAKLKDFLTEKDL